MRKNDLRKVIKESFDESFLGFGKNNEKDAKKAVEVVFNHFKESRNQNLHMIDLFLNGADTLIGYKIETINDVFDAVKGTKCERDFKMFTDNLNKVYRNELPDDVSAHNSWELKKMKISENGLYLEYLERCLDKNDDSKSDEELDEGSARNQTNRRGKNLKPANYPWIRESFEEAFEKEVKCNNCGGEIEHLEIRPHKNDFISSCKECGAKETATEIEIEMEEGNSRSQTNRRGKNKKPSNYPYKKR